MDKLLVTTIELAESNDLEAIKKFVLKIKKKPENLQYINYFMIGFCTVDNVDAVKFLLLESGFNQESIINNLNNSPLRSAAQNNSQDIVKFLLTDKSLTTLADIHAANEEALYCASANSNLSLVRFLCTSPELKEKADTSNRRALEVACHNKDEDIIKFFIHDLQMEILPMVKRKIDSDKKFNMDGRLYEIIDGRDNSINLHKTLNKDLDIKPHTKKIKILKKPRRA